jgi:hypothetical protein
MVDRLRDHDDGDGHYVINVRVQNGKWYWTLKDGRSPVGPFAGERDAAQNCLASLAVYVELMDGVVFSIRYKGRVLVDSQPPRGCTVAAIIAAQARLN